MSATEKNNENIEMLFALKKHGLIKSVYDKNINKALRIAIEKLQQK